MEMSKIITNCPLCEEKSLHVISDNLVNTQQCINCGYATTSKYKFEDKPEDNEFYQQLTESMQKWSKIWKDYIWIPSIMTLPVGMIYPQESDNDGGEMKWAFAEMVEIPKEEQKNYPVEGQKDKYYEKRYLTDEPKLFDEFLYVLAHVNDLMKETTDSNVSKPVNLNIPKLKVTPKA